MSLFFNRVNILLLPLLWYSYVTVAYTGGFATANCPNTETHGMGIELLYWRFSWRFGWRHKFSAIWFCVSVSGKLRKFRRFFAFFFRINCTKKSLKLEDKGNAFFLLVNSYSVKNLECHLKKSESSEIQFLCPDWKKRQFINSLLADKKFCNILSHPFCQIL